MRRILEFRHFEQALREILPKVAQDEPTKQPETREKSSGMDPATLAQFKTFGKMFAAKGWSPNLFNKIMGRATRLEKVSELNV